MPVKPANQFQIGFELLFSLILAPQAAVFEAIHPLFFFIPPLEHLSKKLRETTTTITATATPPTTTTVTTESY